MNSPRPKTPIKLVKSPLSELAYIELKRQILDRELLPGDRLNIDALSRSCGISTSPLREALARLTAEGLVAFAANTGFSVESLPDAQKMAQMMDFRLLMEEHCARLGADRKDADTAAMLQQLHHEMVALRKSGVTYQEHRAYIDLEQRFHQAIVDSAGNDSISHAYRNLHLILAVSRLSVVSGSNQVGSDAAMQEHQEIVTAFAEGDGARAAAAVRGHLQGAAQRMAPHA
ncbi:GntR family transcriptional regulator [Herbaspirillum sp. NPDC087042]|uniref:GntR family transcriptional regulator n=1 Tax=Herbaspirillum sp. NPDC087042 TaxID=3364004 RepID=UPI0037F24D86